jgi:DNA (cytosine-5)-methyltransferase 1
MNIRHCLGEAVPTIIFQQIASKIKNYLVNYNFNEQSIKKLIEDEELEIIENLNSFLKKTVLSFLFNFQNCRIIEYSSNRKFCILYKSSHLLFSNKDLPEAKEFKN